MTLAELPQKIQDELNAERKQLYITMAKNDPYNITLVNEAGTRYFTARRKCESWNDDKGNYMPFGGGSHWSIAYGEVRWDRRRNPVGEYDYFWVLSNKRYGRSKNGTEIPGRVATKKEAIAIAQAIGIFNI